MNQEIQIKIAMSVHQIGVLLMGLGKLPLEVSGDLFMSLKQEADRQIAEANAPKQKPKKEKKPEAAKE